jgi:hypothetical protein
MMASSGMLRRVALVRIDVSEELSASFIRVTRIGELGTELAASLLYFVRNILHGPWSITKRSDSTAGLHKLSFTNAAACDHKRGFDSRTLEG